jgi:hypothetical protein
MRNPELDQTCQTGYDEQSASRDCPTRYAATLRIGHDSHNDRQRRSNRGDNIADPVHKVENCPLGLGGSLSLHSLPCGRLLPEVLGMDHERKELKRSNSYESDEPKAVPGVSATSQSHLLLLHGHHLVRIAGENIRAFSTSSKSPSLAPSTFRQVPDRPGCKKPAFRFGDSS